eukprot:CAMPEP_0204375284 /NCGR_PEP_ID=MMETSP0469-20131031/49120_1 /ASSEMBLY_ACC=CAM_ASM_000384 /TAXON_ID=2969 /ORGANISM="Oxyrrhis marina" /LENGTH=795 /DNA_ID=CAMNT_0051365947 /DNA_START=34 /DNA_END=2421 /DNA_ORIENTATION=+
MTVQLSCSPEGLKAQVPTDSSAGQREALLCVLATLGRAGRVSFESVTLTEGSLVCRPRTPGAAVEALGRFFKEASREWGHLPAPELVQHDETTAAVVSPAGRGYWDVNFVTTQECSLSDTATAILAAVCATSLAVESLNLAIRGVSTMRVRELQHGDVPRFCFILGCCCRDAPPQLQFLPRSGEKTEATEIFTPTTASDASGLSCESTWESETISSQPRAPRPRRLGCFGAFWRPKPAVATVDVAFPNGDSYRGHCVEGLRHGQGTYTYSSQNHTRYISYAGGWRRDQKHGRGVLHTVGGCYAGHFERNQRCGYGVFGIGTRAADMYEGQWLSDGRHGAGLLLSGAEVTVGTYVHDTFLRGVCLRGTLEASLLLDREGASVTPLLAGLKAEGLPVSQPLVCWSPSDLARLADLLGFERVAARLPHTPSVLVHRRQRLIAALRAELITGGPMRWCDTIGTLSGIAEGSEWVVFLRCVEEILKRQHPSGALPPGSNKEATPDVISLITSGACLGFPGDQVELGEQLGQGGFGTVRSGKFRGAEVAVKEFKAAPSSRDAELLREARALAKLDHPNIVGLVGMCSVQSQWCLVTQRLDTTLFQVLHKSDSKSQSRPGQRRLSLRSILGIARGIAAAGEHWGQNHMVHADLKSCNVLLRVRGRHLTPVVCDFGNAVSCVEDCQISCIGTPHWSAPEVCRRERISTQADVYSLGVLCWEMLANQVPFAGLSHAQVVSAVGWALSKPGHFPQDVPSPVVQVFSSMWAACPGARPTFQDAVQVTDDLLIVGGDAMRNMVDGFF